MTITFLPADGSYVVQRDGNRIGLLGLLVNGWSFQPNSGVALMADEVQQIGEKMAVLNYAQHHRPRRRSDADANYG